MILRVAILVFLLIVLLITVSIAINPRRFFGYLSSIYRYEMHPAGPDWKLRLVGIVQSIFVLMMIFLWWKSLP